MARPRDASLDARILRAARKLHADVGPAGVTMAAVAELAGVSRPTLYRRWRTKAELLFAAQTNASVEIEYPEHGSFRDRLVAAVRHLVESMAASDRQLTAENLAHMIVDRDFAEAVFEQRWSPDREQVYPLWEHGVATGDVDADVDGRAVLDDLVALCLYRVFVRHRPPDHDEIDAIVDRILAGVARR